MEGRKYGGKFAFQNQLGLPYKWKEIYRFTLYLRAISEYKSPGGLNIWRGNLTERFLRYEFGALIFEILRYLPELRRLDGVITAN